MKIFKVVGNVIATVGKTIEDVAETISVSVGDEGLKHSTRQAFKIVNISLDQSVEMALLESEEELKAFRKEHNISSKK